MSQNQFTGNGKAKPGSAAPPAGKWREQVGANLVRQSLSRIRHPYRDHAVFALSLKLNVPLAALQYNKTIKYEEVFLTIPNPG